MQELKYGPRLANLLNTCQKDELIPVKLHLRNEDLSLSIPYDTHEEIVQLSAQQFLTSYLTENGCRVKEANETSFLDLRAMPQLIHAICAFEFVEAVSLRPT
jgi:hypothetical protein